MGSINGIVYAPRGRGGWRSRPPAVRREVEKYDRPWRVRQRARRRRVRWLLLIAVAVAAALIVPEVLWP